jgi:sugar lactone lactonase YvrE
MKYSKWILCVTAVVAAVSVAVAQEKGGNDETGPYDVVHWPQPLDKDWTWGRTPAVEVDNDSRIIVLQSNELPVAEKRSGNNHLPLFDSVAAKNIRRENTIMIFDIEGRLQECWKQYNHLFNNLHRVRLNPYDPERHVWIVDSGSQQVFKLTRDGKKIAMTIGEFKVRGDDPKHLTGPTDVAFAPNGDIYVSNTNDRIARFSKDGTFISQWGKAGKGPGEFGNPHGLTVDGKRQRVMVADRENSRVQIFDMNGKYLDEWPNIRGPEFVGVSRDDTVWVVDGHSNKILQFDLNGKLRTSWGTFGADEGQFWGVHHLSVDSKGNLYTAEVYGGRAQKFTPKKGADSNRLVRPFGPKTS